MLEIYYKSKGKLNQIGICKGKLFGENYRIGDAIALIDDYLKNTLEPSFEALYYRIIYHEEDKTATVDYGSHVNFMVLKEVEDND